MSEVEKYDDDKTAFMREVEMLRPDLFYPESWGSNEAAEVAEEIRPNRIKTGILSAIPMTCRGDRCPVANTCPLLSKNLAPEGKPCPIEMAMVQQFFLAYVEELGVDTDRMVEVSMIRTLVDQEIQYLRTSKILSLEHFIQDNVVGVSDNGEPIMKKELHMAVDLQDKIHRRMERIRSQLLATRESRAKAGQAMVDTAQHIANLMDDFQKIEEINRKLIRKKLGKGDVDEYIEASEAEIVDAETIDGI